MESGVVRCGVVLCDRSKSNSNSKSQSNFNDQ